MKERMEFPIRKYYNHKAAIEFVRKHRPKLDKSQTKEQAVRLYQKYTRKFLRQVERFKAKNPKEYKLIHSKYIEAVVRPEESELIKEIRKLKRNSKRQYLRHKALLKRLLAES